MDELIIETTPLDWVTLNTGRISKKLFNKIIAPEIKHLQAQNKELKEKINQLQKHSQMREEKLVAKNKEQEKALEFYANTDNWKDFSFDCYYGSIDQSDCDVPDWEDDKHGGKRARAVLEKYKKELK
jgi:hypothetical protein